MKIRNFILIVAAVILFAGNVLAEDGKSNEFTSGAPAGDNHESNNRAEDRDWRFMYDDQGRALILHGTSISNNAKWQPDGHPRAKRGEVIGLARDWGFNLVRYLIFWARVDTVLFSSAGESRTIDPDNDG